MSGSGRDGTGGTVPALLDRLERYYDAVPRSGARAEDFGALTLFVRTGPGWPFYARPTVGWTGSVTAADVTAVRARQRELGLPESFEWVAEVTPGLRAAATGAGLAVHEHPLMVLEPGTPTPVPAPALAGLVVRVVRPHEPALFGALAVPDRAFAEPGTAIGAAGTAELAVAEQARRRDESVPRTIEWMETGRSAIVAAIQDGVVLSAGRHQPVGPVSEIVGVGTLPAARRRGLARRVTAGLVADARAGGVELVFLSAGDADVARIYAGLGFRAVGTALIAELA